MYKTGGKTDPKTFLKLSKCDKTPQKFFSFSKNWQFFQKNTECVNLYSYIPYWYAVACW